MKIVFLNIDQGQANRGAETFVLELSRRLKKMGHKVSVISGQSAPPKRWPILWRLFIDPYGLYICWFTLKNLPRIWREKPDIVVPVNGGWQPAFVRLVTWLYKGKMVISGQSGMGWDDRNNLWSFPDAFVALSTKAKNWAKRANPFVKIKYIPNGVDTNKFTPRGHGLKISLKKPVILCVGALVPTKRIDLVIRAVSRLKDVSLLVVGDGDLKAELKRIGKGMLGDRFELTKVPFEKMPQVYRAADVFTLVSESYYSFEIVLVEAMASGLPVVANQDEIRTEIVGEAGILVDPTDIGVYTEALKQALSKKWEDRSQVQAKKFDWDRIAKKYEKLFVEVTKK